MNRTALLAGLALAFAAPAFAQDAPQTAPVADEPTADAQTEVPASAPRPARHAHSTTRYHGPHRYPMKTRGRAGDPPIVDHSADTLVVEPTHSSVTVVSPTP